MRCVQESTCVIAHFLHQAGRHPVWREAREHQVVEQELLICTRCDEAALGGHGVETGACDETFDVCDATALVRNLSRACQGGCARAVAVLADYSALRCLRCCVTSSKVLAQLRLYDACHGLAAIDVVVDLLTAISGHTKRSFIAKRTRVHSLVTSAPFHLWHAFKAQKEPQYLAGM